ncbi:hypothetical protein H7T43_09550 [Peribacillus simplex]|uniref:hypothetical protein n=1 Tax=Peribacillus simplex TaxID=1478 RepID=UPI002989CAF3|nr:hypothetical protein [Peribacillus simplex]MBX9955155.1 hypothetical protein [Peribacillus simplex]
MALRKKYEEELLALAKNDSSFIYQGELYRLWRLDPDDIETSMEHTDFPDSLSQLERAELEGGYNVEIGQNALKFIVEHIITKKSFTKKGRSHSITQAGCNFFIDNHAGQYNDKWPFVITKVENSGLDLAIFAEKHGANENLVQSFRKYEEILSEHDYSNNNYIIITIPRIEIYHEGIYRPVIE